MTVLVTLFVIVSTSVAVTPSQSSTSRTNETPWSDEYLALVYQIKQISHTHSTAPLVNNSSFEISVALDECNATNCDIPANYKCDCRKVRPFDLCRVGVSIRPNCSQVPPCADQPGQYGARCWGDCSLPYNTYRTTPIGVLTCMSNEFQVPVNCEDIPNNTVHVYGCKTDPVILRCICDPTNIKEVVTCPHGGAPLPLCAIP
jgi:hypothetical protein